MKPNDPIDYDSPLGISKKEWTKVLGANLALLLLVYAIALVCTLCGSDLFLLNFHSDDLQRIEETLRNWNIFPLVQMAFSTIEEVIILAYTLKEKPKWWWIAIHFSTYVGLNFLMMATIGYVPSFVPLILGITMAVVLSVINHFKKKQKLYKCILRLLIVSAISLALNELIGLFRTKMLGIGAIYPNSALFALSIEYDLALILASSFLTLVIPWEKGGNTQWEMLQAAGGCSQTSMNSLPKNSKTAKTNISPKYRKRLRLLKLKVIAIQTIALIVIAALPWFTGRPVEFALVYASFCFTRIALGFNRSLHFKSELSCVTIGALCFWALTFLTPSVEVLIILSLCYGAGLALGFRLYWELHDLMMYRKASKTDRYAMLYVVFKGNVNPKHINGVMRAKGYSDKIEIEMVQMYMRKDKVEYIASYFSFAKITVEKKLTEIASDLYIRR